MWPMLIFYIYILGIIGCLCSQIQYMLFSNEKITQQVLRGLREIKVKEFYISQYFQFYFPENTERYIIYG